MKSRSLIGLSVFLLISSCGNKKNAAATTPEAINPENKCGMPCLAFLVPAIYREVISAI